MNIEYREVDLVIPYSRNPRKNESAVGKVAKSIQEFGFRQPVVVDSQGVIIVGHTRWKAAKSLGLKQIPVHVADISEAQAKAYRLADNRTNEIAGWDFKLLSGEIKKLSMLDFDLTTLGFKEIEIREFLGDFEALGDAENSIPKIVNPRVRWGEVWELGDHLLLCGDSSDQKSFEILFGKGGGGVDLVFTDPPYGVNYEGKTKEKLRIKNDQGEADLYAPVFPALENTLNHCREGSCWYVCAPSGPLNLHFGKWLHEARIWKQTINWVKDAFVLGRSDYHYRHEPIFYGWKEGAAHRAPESRDQDTVWNIPRPKASHEHPTMKPVELVEKAIVNSSEKGWIVFDPFMGSGTTLIASEKTGRKSHGIEIDPRYCDVIISRFEKFSGKQARLRTP